MEFFFHIPFNLKEFLGRTGGHSSDNIVSAADTFRPVPAGVREILQVQKEVRP